MPPSKPVQAITADDPLRSLLHDLASSIGGRPVDLVDEHKARYHAAAALANNYTTTLVWHAVATLTRCGVEEPDATAAMLSLVNDVTDNVARSGPAGALTGPLVRGDLTTVEAHLDALADAPETAALYRACVAATRPVLRAREAAARARD